MSQARQARAIRTREKILRAAAEVFDEHGFSGASMNKIVRTADTTMGAMYFHFASKEEIAKAVMAEQATDLSFTDGEDGLQRLVYINLELAHQMRTNVLFRAGVRLAVEQGEFGMRDAAPYRIWIDLFRGQLEAARARGELLPGVDAEDFAEILVGAYTGTQLMSNITTGRENLIGRISALWGYLLPSIAAPGVIARLDLTGKARTGGRGAARL
ncbi:ScbR family autoregulator-binding transcription factor [Streptomyces sp. G-G2]|uniref:ScbR family autoregulator-binding transcription factor n=1 Tax=Streptomyces sp. G-G2 TaxID=3046201 RepID=UPI0024BB6576|nr:ScbR family autoregulator-binding transcription factor [Streptomyces sp. G-G2]MDJ0382874.1 ScbR family autoregulator-binding transcription factor [Streptomyces sp. G-G2]